jgi:phenylacetate-CoA ligase
MAVTGSPQEWASSFDGRVRDLVGTADGWVQGFAQRLKQAGLTPSELSDVASLDRLPVLRKDELLDLQEQDPPFAGFLAPAARPRRIFQSPGPMYEPDLGGPDPWRWVPALRAAGFTEEDVVFNAFSYHLSPAGAMFEEAARALGCTVVPGGVGSPDLQVRACVDVGVTAIIALPSYLKALIEKAESLNVFPRPWSPERAFVAAEPLPDSLRGWLLERIPTVRQGYGTAESGNLGFECHQMSGLHLPHDTLVQICDISTGEALWDGAEGEVVATVFSPEYPMVRFGTGDLSAFMTEACSCDIGTPRIAGWLGRVGEAVKVRGMFLHPRQVDRVMEKTPGVSRFRFVVTREGDKDRLRCEVIVEDGKDLEALSSDLRSRIRSALRFDTEVRPVDSLEPDSPAIVDLRTWG